MRQRGIAAPIHHEQSCRSSQQAEAATSAKRHREARVRIGREPAEQHVIDRRDRRRRKAEQKPVERAVMHPAAPRSPRLLGVDAVLAGGVKVLQRQRIASGKSYSRAAWIFQVRYTFTDAARALGDTSSEPSISDAQREDGEDARGSK